MPTLRSLPPTLTSVSNSDLRLRPSTPTAAFTAVIPTPLPPLASDLGLRLPTSAPTPTSPPPPPLQTSTSSRSRSSTTLKAIRPMTPIGHLSGPASASPTSKMAAEDVVSSGSHALLINMYVYFLLQHFLFLSF